jgi:hypothetical protein
VRVGLLEAIDQAIAPGDLTLRTPLMCWPLRTPAQGGWAGSMRGHGW